MATVENCILMVRRGFVKNVRVWRVCLRGDRELSENRLSLVKKEAVVGGDGGPLIALEAPLKSEFTWRSQGVREDVVRCAGASPCADLG